MEGAGTPRPNRKERKNKRSSNREGGWRMDEENNIKQGTGICGRKNQYVLSEREFFFWGGKHMTTTTRRGKRKQCPLLGYLHVRIRFGEGVAATRANGHTTPNLIASSFFLGKEGKKGGKYNRKGKSEKLFVFFSSFKIPLV